MQPTPTGQSSPRIQGPWAVWAGSALAVLSYCLPLSAADVLPPVPERFRSAETTEVPSFQKHVVPLFGQLGCNGRACHGSFQGRGGFRLSLFGYDFQADHTALFDKESPRVSVEKPAESLIITKPTDADLHEGGKRYELGSWQHNVIAKWIQSGARWQQEDLQKLARLVVTPAEIDFQQAGQQVQLRAVAVWADGTQEDVTPLCRFQTNDDQVASISPTGLVTAREKGDTHVVVSYDKAVIPVGVLRPVTELTGDRYPEVATPTRIDELVVAKLRRLGIVPSELCTDAEFLRRVSLDLTGTLPTADEVRSFLQDSTPDKRRKKVDELLESPAYAAWWTTKLCDFTTNNDQSLNNVGVVRGAATQDWWDWIYQRVSQNSPYDQLISGIVLGRSRQEGESYREYCERLSEIARHQSGRSFAERESMPYYWARQNIRQPEEKAISFAYSFMGVRIECAQCHKHPFDQWSKADFDEFKKFFSQIAYNQNGVRGNDGRDKEEYDQLVAELGLNDKEKFKNNNDRRRFLEEQLKDGKTVPFPEVAITPAARPAALRKNRKESPAPAGPKAQLLGGGTFDLAQLADPRQPLMDWLRSRDNPYFAPAFVNRVWANYFHAGIINPTDDLNLANAPSNRPLLDYLAAAFIESGFDMKWLHREITSSRTYQLSWRTNDTNQLDERNFSHAVPRRLPAEVAYDAVYSAVVSDQRATAMRTDWKGRAIAIPGANARNAGGGNASFALSVFGRSTRETNCDCDRSMDASLLQTVYLQNDAELRTRLEARDSWIKQVTLANAKQAAGPGGADRAAEIKSLERQLARLRQQKNTERAEKLQAQLNKLRAADQKSAAGAEKPATDPQQAKQLIETAYLRSLSRFPTSDEMVIASQHLVESSDLTQGLEDLLWALVNTKEFIVNH